MREVRHEDSGMGSRLMPVPDSVVNEYEGVQSDVEKIARQLHGQHQDEPVWDKLDGHKRDDYHLFAARVLQCPSVRAAFEAQAKLEAVEGLLLRARRLIRDEDVWSAVDFITEHVALVEEGGESS